MAFDEAASLEAVVDELEATLNPLAVDYQVLIVDDGSSDGTGEIADRLAGERPAVEVIHHRENLGLGGVYQTGLFRSSGRFVSFFPADGQFPPTAIETFLPLSEDHDLVLGYLPDRRDSPVGALLSRLEKMLKFLLFGSTPRFQGVFLLRRAVLDAYTLESSGRGWGIVMEMILRTQRAGFRIVSVPTGIRPRMAGQSKVQVRWVLWTHNESRKDS
jgi:glycosyltransferase involved in cell wall biosynthesis